MYILKSFNWYWTGDNWGTRAMAIVTSDVQSLKALAREVGGRILRIE